MPPGRNAVGESSIPFDSECAIVRIGVRHSPLRHERSFATLMENGIGEFFGADGVVHPDLARRDIAIPLRIPPVEKLRIYLSPNQRAIDDPDFLSVL